MDRSSRRYRRCGGAQAGTKLWQGCVCPAALLSERYHVHPAVLDGVFQLVSFCDLAQAASCKAWVPVGIKSLKMNQGSRLMQVCNLDSADEWMWASARHVQSSSQVQIVDMTVYDTIAGDVGLSVEGFRYGALGSDLKVCVQYCRPPCEQNLLHQLNCLAATSCVRS